MIIKLLRLLIMTMKLSTYGVLLQVFFMSVLFAHNGSAQFSNTKEIVIQQNINGITVKEAFDLIETNTDFKLFYFKKHLDKEARITMNSKSERSVYNILMEISKQSALRFKQVNNVISVSPISKHDKNTDIERVQILADIEISGKITDENGQGLPGTSVLQKGTTNGVTSDLDGNYSLTVPEEATLTISFVGYKTIEMVVGSENVIDIQMEIDAEQLEEIVIVGYGEQKKEHLTSSVAVVDTRDLNNRPVKSLSEMLTASVPNLNINISSTAPNAEPSLNIRGFTGLNSSGEPLVLVDGFPMDIKNVNPTDVESISVLKDAAASAVYGSRAPNGVILITTKSGTKGGEMRVNYSMDYQVSTPLGLPTQLNSLEYIDHVDERAINSGFGTVSAEQRDNITKFLNGEITAQNVINSATGKYQIVSGYNANVDNFDAAFRDNTVNIRHNLDLSGGTDKTTYYASFGINDRQGIYESDVDYLERYTASLRVRTDVTDYLKVGFNVKYVRDESERPRIWNTNQNNGDALNNVASDGRLFDALVLAPYFPIWDDNGSPNQFSIVPNLDGRSGTFQNTEDDLWTKFDFALEPLEGLVISGDYAHNFRNRTTDITSFIFQGEDADGTPVDSRRNPTLNSVQKVFSNKDYHIANLKIAYTKTVAENHNFHAMVGYNEEGFRFEEISTYNTDFYSTAIPSLSGTFGDNASVNDDIEAFGLQGYFFRFNYNYKGKYLLEANSRYDASSRFPSDQRWANFLAFSAGYNVHMEDFWSPLENVINRFKITGNWGELGDFSSFDNARELESQNNYPYISTLGTVGQSGVIISGARPALVTQPSLVSANLTWARPRTMGFGIDIGAFDNRLGLEYQWYQRTTYDQVGPALTAPEVLGTNPPVTNSTVSETRGWELSVLWKDQLTEALGSPINYSLRAGLSDYIGYVVDYIEPNLTGTRGGFVPGQRFGELYGYTGAGIAQSFEEAALENVTYATNNNAFGPWALSGILLIEDTNGDGQIDQGQGNLWYAEGDRKRIGFSYPRFKYNFAFQFDWKGLSLSALFDGVGHQYRHSVNKFVVGTRNHASPYQVNELGYWSPDNTDAFFPRLNRANLNQSEFRAYPSDQYVLNLSHLRIKNINLSYQLPARIVEKIKLNSASFNVSVENVGFIYNKMWNKEIDPQSIASGNANEVRSGATAYPIQRTVSLGLRVGI